MPSYSTLPRRGALASLIVSLGLAVTGCAPLIVGGAVAGASAVYDRRHYQVVLDDQRIELAAMQALSQDPDIRDRARIAVTSYNHSALLTGQADSEAIAQRAGDLVSRIPKVTRVIDEIGIGASVGMARTSDDALITSRAKLELTSIDLPDFNPTRVKVVTENGVVYLMGLVSPSEAEAAAERIRYVPGVRQVIKLFEYSVSDA
ncbi:BON domain-containing protein [Thiocystis violacea]|uniref:BON domain-containing protein n=1 Tax=Thiocystis violacea TaxID=13725 RepID=UPI0019045A10|nr:BON domain-containing protein [Thiocystis violacea]MBK1716483.1 transporter [Thiocystis violacea]